MDHGTGIGYSVMDLGAGCGQTRPEIQVMDHGTGCGHSVMDHGIG